MFKLRLLALICLLPTAVLWAQDKSTQAVSSDAGVGIAPSTVAVSTDSRPASELADVVRTLGLGKEEYVYSVEWGILKVGKATLGSPRIVTVSGKMAYHIVSTARTLPFLDALKRVRDRNEAWLDAKDFISL